MTIENYRPMKLIYRCQTVSTAGICHVFPGRNSKGEASFADPAASLTANICLEVDQHCILRCMEEGA